MMDIEARAPYQKQVYSRMLLEKSISELQRLGCVKVNLQVRASNQSIVEFYQHLGFQARAYCGSNKLAN